MPGRPAGHPPSIRTFPSSTDFEYQPQACWRKPTRPVMNQRAWELTGLPERIFQACGRTGTGSSSTRMRSARRYVNFYGRDITERKRAAALEQLWGVGQAMSRNLALPETLDRIVQTARDLLRTDYARLTFWDGTRKCLTHAAQAGAESLPIRHVRQAGAGFAGVVAKTSKTLIVNDYKAFRLSPPKNTEIHRQNSVHTRIDSQAVVHQPSRMMPRAPCLHLRFPGSDRNLGTASPQRFLRAEDGKAHTTIAFAN